MRACVCVSKCACACVYACVCVRVYSRDCVRVLCVHMCTRVSIAHALVRHWALQVLATLFDVGDFNPALDQLGLPAWAALPVAQRVPLDAHVDPARLLPQKLSYFAYAGSLSYPPCTEVCGSCRVRYRAAWDISLCRVCCGSF